MSEPPATPESGSSWTADGALLATAVIWGVNIPIMKHGVGMMDRLGFNALRMTLSAIILGILILHERRPPKGDTPWRRVILVAVLGGFFYQVSFVMGIRKTLAGNTALIIASTPVWTALLAWTLGVERLRRLAWVGLSLTCLGAMIVTLDPTKLDLKSDYVQGNLLILGASFLWAASSVFSRPLFEYVTPTRFAFISAAVTLPGHYAIAGKELIASLQVVSTDLTALGCVMYSGIFSTGLAYAFWNFGLRKVGPSHSSIYANLVPVVALGSGWLMLGETITDVQIPGGLLILGGIIVMRRTR